MIKFANDILDDDLIDRSPLFLGQDELLQVGSLGGKNRRGTQMLSDSRSSAYPRERKIGKAN